MIILVQLCAKPGFYPLLILFLEVMLSTILSGDMLRLTCLSSPICRRHRGTRVRVDVRSGVTPLRGPTSIHLERIPHVDSVVSQR